MKEDKIIKKVYVVKYALTQGIQIFENVEVCTAVSDGTMIQVEKNYFFYKGDWYTDPNNAIREAENMRFKKIESMKKKIIKLEKMKFKI